MDQHLCTNIHPCRPKMVFVADWISFQEQLQRTGSVEFNDMMGTWWVRNVDFWFVARGNAFSEPRVLKILMLIDHFIHFEPAAG